MRRLENLMQTFFQSDPESAQPFPREKREIINNLINDVISGAEQALAVAGTLSASDDCESLINDFAKPNLNDLKSEYEILLSNTSDSEEREIQMANYLVYSMFLATKIMAVHSSHETLLRCEANVPGW